MNQDPRRIAVFASGTGSNLQAIIDAQSSGALSVDLVVVMSNRPGCGALAKAKKAGIETRCFSKEETPSREAFEEAVLSDLQKFEVGSIVLAGFDRMISPKLIHAYPHRILNIHPALLPAFPGLHAVRQALEYGARITGVTVHFIDEGMDTGPIILQESLSILPGETEEALLERIHEIEHRLYPEAIRLLAEGRLEIDGRQVRIL